MKLSLIFSLFVLLVACASTKPLNNLETVTKINKTTVFYEHGNISKLPSKTGTDAMTIFLVRHAEKASEGGRDPLLTKKGSERANRLSNILMEAGINKVYSTIYQRTQLTAKPTANNLETGMMIYDAKDLKGFAAKLQKEEKGNTILVVGHSNTTPNLVNLLIGEAQFETIDESDYGNLFVVSISGGGKSAVNLLKY